MESIWVSGHDYNVHVNPMCGAKKAHWQLLSLSPMAKVHQNSDHYNWVLFSDCIKMEMVEQRSFHLITENSHFFNPIALEICVCVCAQFNYSLCCSEIYFPWVSVILIPHPLSSLFSSKHHFSTKNVFHHCNKDKSTKYD